MQNYIQKLHSLFFEGLITANFAAFYTYLGGTKENVKRINFMRPPLGGSRLDHPQSASLCSNVLSIKVFFIHFQLFVQPTFFSIFGLKSKECLLYSVKLVFNIKIVRKVFKLRLGASRTRSVGWSVCWLVCWLVCLSY